MYAGFPMNTLKSSTCTGRIGEFFAMYMLEKHGIECHHVDRSGVDLWCQSHDGTMFTLQVKSAYELELGRKKGTRRRYSFNLRASKVADFYMFVALEKERIIVKTPDELGNKIGLQISPRTFTEEKMAEGLHRLKTFRMEDRLQPQ